MSKFAHIIKDCFSFGLMHMEFPKCIVWFGSGFDDPEFEWIDNPTINDANRIIQELEMQEIELGINGNNSIPLLYYEKHLYS